MVGFDGVVITLTSHSGVIFQGLCAAVTVILHYLFLSVFSWMLAEGIMLYLLVVRVFGTLASRWYYLLILGWGESSLHPQEV